MVISIACWRVVVCISVSATGASVESVIFDIAGIVRIADVTGSDIVVESMISGEDVVVVFIAASIRKVVVVIGNVSEISIVVKGAVLSEIYVDVYPVVC